MARSNRLFTRRAGAPRRSRSTSLRSCNREALGLSLLLAAAAVGAQADVPVTAAPSGSEAIAVPSGHRLKLTWLGTGAQRYQCMRDGDAFGWRFESPEAGLSDLAGHPTGSHGEGPHWRALDGSGVTGTARARVEAGGHNVPWLLLEVSEHTGQGVLDDVVYIQRVQTHGGLAPESDCSESNVGERRAVPYSALYKFFVPESSAPKPPQHAEVDASQATKAKAVKPVR